MNDRNSIQIIKEIFYRMANDKDLTIEQVRELAEQGYIAARDLNEELKEIYSAIGRLMTI